MEQIMDKLISFASILEPKTKAQACETAKMPFIYPHLALMPDAHLGKGATVGSVIPTVGAIMPAAVGVDIGCGMMAVRTQWTESSIQATTLGPGIDRGLSEAECRVEADRALARLHKAISTAVPLSAGAANGKIFKSAEKRISELENTVGIEQADLALPHWRMQLGTLGSGNHFIEISLDEEDRVWLFLHSGSRGVGNKLAMKHIKIAQAQCLAAGVKLVDRDLAYLTEGTVEFDAYIEALQWAQHFALLNREEMMQRVVGCIEDFMGLSVLPSEIINCHHNYTVKYPLVVDGTTDYVWLSRKGAIDANVGVYGLIPGSMGDKSYVVVGKGNGDALWSAPHGAGRNYSRSAAKKMFTREDLNERMTGITWGESDAFIDEHPLAYKPIDVVMNDAADLVDVVHELRQFVNIKGN